MRIPVQADLLWVHYENVAYFNFETNPRLNETFEENISPDYLIPLLSHIAGQTIVREKTLIVFDEVQLCERALTSLKYFCEGTLVEQIKTSFQTNMPLPSALHDAAMQLHRQYLVVGGMPECVKQFAETRDYILISSCKKAI